MEKPWYNSWPKDLPKTLDYPNIPLHQTLDDTAKRLPDKTSLIYYGTEIPFKEVKENADRFATILADIGVEKGDRVMLYLENSPQFVMAYYGAHKAGAIIVPANPMFKEMELEYEIKDSGAETIIALDQLYPFVEKVRDKTDLKNVFITNIGEYFPEEPTLPIMDALKVEKKNYPNTIDFLEKIEDTKPNPPKLEFNPKEDLALLQYTAGTTGMPKGAMITHSNIMTNVYGGAKWVGTTDKDISVGVLPLFHATGMVHSMCNPILVGATSVLLARFDLAAFLEAISKYRCTLWVGITTIAVAIAMFADPTKYDMTSLRGSFAGGAPLGQEVIKKYKEITGSDMIEGYGLSESISQVTINPVDKPKYGSVGIPVFDVDAKVVDGETGEKELGFDQEGELIFKGPQIMKGYWKNPEKTKETLKDGWLYTGDIGKMDKDGYIWIVGRKKEMINVSGYKVWPFEVEDFLYKHEAVQEVGVVGVPDEYRGETVKAVIVLKPDYKGKVSEEDIIKWSKEKMAAYKYPRIVEFKDSLPKSGAGKVLRRVLLEEHLEKMKEAKK
ncbi:MAG: AMP-binding protein [Candidatus Jordarchaeum sp.]|uniref:AMP-binding protein n=1 Tax=Candidatus Jordarchaeum sp. TaxID=2823881 RepID=UPI00404A9969